MNNYIVYNIKEMLRDLGKAIKEKTPFSVVSLGDAELIFLACPEIATINTIDKYLAISGVDSSMVELKKEIIKLLPENNYVFAHSLEHKEDDPQIEKTEWAKFFYMYPEIFEHYKIKGISLITKISLKYGMVTSGELFKILAGQKILLVGFHAPEVERRMKDPAYVKHYEKINIHKLNIVGSIGCSEFKTVGGEVDDMLEQAKEIDFDIALLAMGIPATYLGPKLKQTGKIAIDIGHIMTALAGKGEKHRSYISEFDFD